MNNPHGMRSYSKQRDAITNERGIPVPGVWNRKRRKMKRGKGGMMFSRYFHVPQEKWCCWGHDGVIPDRGTARAREKRSWKSEI